VPGSWHPFARGVGGPHGEYTVKYLFCTFN
jgi:hypothetical protein